VYELRMHLRRVSAARIGLTPPTPPLTVTLYRPAPAERVGTIASCRQRGTRIVCAGTRRPNFIVVVTDDQRWDTIETMPTLQALAAQGVRFTNAFVPTPICGPSRASMLTGTYAHATGVTQDSAALKFVGADASTFATWLHDAGYRTGMFGKYLVDYQRQCPPFTASCYVPPGWDEWQVFRTQGYLAYQLTEGSSLVTYGSAQADYSTDVLATKVVRFIEGARGQPFMAHLGTAAPHGNGPGLPLPAVRHQHLFGDLTAWRPVSYDEPDFTDKPVWMQSQPRASDPSGGVLTYGVWTDLFRHAQLASLAAVDEALTAIVDALDAAGEADNTVIVITSDNGFLWGEHRVFANKVRAFDESLRVPLIVSSPAGMGASREENALVLSLDIAPTLADLAGVAPSSTIDGRSLVPLLHGAAASWRADFLIEYVHEFLDPPTYRGVRSREWKYIAYPDIGEGELYDLVNDPFELQNLYGDPAYAAQQATLLARAEALAGDE
jgi:arylsulfatase A-like enzyme